jgi:hypothetical protein
VPTIDRAKHAPASGLARGAYILADTPGADPEVILIGTGSEASLSLQSYEPRQRSVSSGSIPILFGWLGIRSVLPASRGTQRLWSVSADSNLMKVGVGGSGSLTGTCNSFAVTTCGPG